MRFNAILVSLLVSMMLLSSCWWNTNTDNTSKKGATVNVPEAIRENIDTKAKEQEKIKKLDTLNSENLATQVKEENGKKTLTDRRLFLNYLKKENINNASSLMAGLAKVEKFATESGVELNDSDIIVLISGIRLEKTDWNMCESFNNTKKNLDSTSKYYTYINRLCTPIPRTGSN